ncbi:hypothetical protein [Sinosporangium siamense]|uniref:Uncharacterized protein n=1 Tax=Sinosporangium siamense TaxID=1367973 RepID=A0A919RL48_9ACTN|nr:hypothetical protein [Sinosporangium siamense]GII95826.1 hypothetical protein Ssi02_60570 [Sinosporangium siamense]
MDKERSFSRRKALRAGAVAAAAAAAATGINATANAASAAAPPAAAGGRADLARVVKVDGARLVVDAPASAAGVQAVRTAEQVPLVGFPAGFVPRPGDLVSVVDSWPGKAVAAVPVCHWVTGVAKALPGGGFSVDGQRIAATALLDGQANTRLRVCLLDTELPTAQVLATRAA